MKIDHNVTLDENVTFQTVKGVRSIDYIDLCEKAEQDLDTLRRLLYKNSNDKNVQAVVKQAEEDVKKMREQAYDWLKMVELKSHMPSKIVILLSQDEEDEEDEE